MPWSARARASSARSNARSCGPARSPTPATPANRSSVRASERRQLRRLLDARLDRFAHAALRAVDVLRLGVGVRGDLDADLDRLGQRLGEVALLLGSRDLRGASADLVDVGLAGVLGALNLLARQRRHLRLRRGLLLLGAGEQHAEDQRAPHPASTRASTTEMLSTPPSSFAAWIRRVHARSRSFSVIRMCWI